MNYKVKNRIQQILSNLPYSNKLNRLFQIYISKSLPISDTDLKARFDIVSKHLQNYNKFADGIPQSVLDVGSGADLAIPILFGKKGIKKVVATDIYRLASKFLIDNILRRVGIYSLEQANVEYIIYDGYTLPFEDKTFNFITTTSVFEHVPDGVIINLINEMKRCLSQGGVCSHYVAHIDHWSHTDHTFIP